MVQHAGGRAPPAPAKAPKPSAACDEAEECRPEATGAAYADVCCMPNGSGSMAALGGAARVGTAAAAGVGAKGSKAAAGAAGAARAADAPPAGKSKKPPCAGAAGAAAAPGAKGSNMLAAAAAGAAGRGGADCQPAAGKKSSSGAADGAADGAGARAGAGAGAASARLLCSASVARGEGPHLCAQHEHRRRRQTHGAGRAGDTASGRCNYDMKTIRKGKRADNQHRSERLGEKLSSFRQP